MSTRKPKSKRRVRNNAENGTERVLFKGYFRCFLEGVKQFCSKGSLHGLKYITDDTKSLEERFLWLVVCAASVTVCGYYIFQLWTVWMISAVNLVVSDTYTPIYDIPFPTVVICPEITIKRSKMDLSNVTDQKSLFEASLICENMFPENYSLPNYESVKRDFNVLDFIIEKSPSCVETLKSCSFISLNGIEEITNDCCPKLFKPILTENGLCFGFNMLVDLPKEVVSLLKQNNKSATWNAHDGYPADHVEVSGEEHAPYPRRVFSTGDSFGLTVELYANRSEFQEMCNGQEFGFKVMVDSPKISAITHSFASIPMERQTTFSIMPKKVTTDEDMISVKPNDRKCYFEQEVNLKYFPYYTQFNCIQECEIKYTIAYCHCVPFFFNVKIPEIIICSTYEQYECHNTVKGEVNIKTIENFYETKIYNSKFTPIKKPVKPAKPITWCNCWPNCDELSFNMEIFYSDFLKYNSSLNQSESTRSEVAKFNVNFKEPLFFGYHRQLKFSNIDFLGACGGVLGLFLGFSIMSIFELFYYVIFIPLYSVVTVKLHKKSVAPRPQESWKF